MSKLVQLETGVALPPLSQSRYEAMACPKMYSHLHVEGKDAPVSGAARRGREVHEVIAEYVKHLVAERRKTDVQFFEALAAECSPEAVEALHSFHHTYIFEPQQVYAAELYIALDEHFFVADESGRPKVYEGTLDLVQLVSTTEAVCDDWKSWYQIADADTFQSKLYPLLLFCLNPSLEKITFRLQFVRWGAVREAVYTRADVEKLRTIAERERKRQVELHLAGGSEEARPGAHCTWCPLLLHGCPILEQNPFAQRTPQETLERVMVMKKALAADLVTLKAWVNECGPVGTQDANGTVYQAAFERSERRSFPLVESLPILEEAKRKGDDLLAPLSISGLTPYLKAKKRAVLRERLAEVQRVKVGTKFVTGEAEEADEGEE